MTKTRILLADDHAVLREGMKSLINAELDMEVVGEAADGGEVLELVTKLQPGVIVMDLSMTEIGGAEATRQLKQKNQLCKVLVLTVHEDRNYLREVLEAGAQGYMLKRAAPEELIQAIRAISSGTVYIDSRLATTLLNVIVEQQTGSQVAGAPELSKREYEVMRHIAEGFSNKEIAGVLNISVKTIESHKARALEKLGLSSRTDVIRLARQRKWDPLG